MAQDTGIEIDAELKRLAAVVILGAIMSILDTTIVNVAIDAMSRDFKSPISTIQWVATGYLLALSVVIPLSGWAIERYGARKMWLMSLVLFLVGSALCGVAWNPTVLIVFRVLQGFGGGMIMPIGQSILATAAGPQRMGRIMSVLGVPMLLGPILGPVIGGLIVDSISWNWIFYVNVPIGIVAIVAAVRVLPKRDEVHHHVKLDVTSLLLLSPGLAAVVYGLAQAGLKPAPDIWIPVAIGMALVGAFVWHALTTKQTPLIDVRLFGDRSFTAASLTSIAFGMTLFAAMFLLPLYYQVARGESALSAGLLMAPQGIGAALVMPLAGRLTDRIGAGRVVPVGLLLALIGTFPYTHLGAHTSYVWLACSLLVRGFGFGFVMMPAMAAAYQTLAPGQVPRATTAINIVQRVGGSIGTALIAEILVTQIGRQLPHAAGSSASLAGATVLPPAARRLLADPLAHAFGSTFWWVLAMTVVGFVPAAFLPRLRGRRSAAGTGGDHDEEPTGAAVHVAPEV